jgi:hypothetical protein
MLMAEAKIRTAAAEEDISKRPWEPGLRHFYIWNHVTKRIEMFNIRAMRGVIAVSEVKPKETGVFTLLPVSKTESGTGDADVELIVTDRDITMKVTNRVNADGERLDDVEYRSQRVEK